MTKTIKRRPHTRTTCNPVAPFKLNKEARDYIAAHERCIIAERAFREAHPLGKQPESMTPGAERLRDRWHAESRKIGKRSDALARRLERASRITLSDALLLAMASWHSAKARAGVSNAVLRAAKINAIRVMARREGVNV